MKNIKFNDSHHGLFQGSVISPILSNIYLHKFDIFMSELCESFNQGKQCKTPLIYRNISYFMSKTNNSLWIKNLRRDFWRLNSKDFNFKKLIYVRYLNDFIIGVIGSYKDTFDIQEKIRCFLRNHLSLILSDQKTLITHFNKDFIYFLGVLIKSNWEKKKNNFKGCFISSH